MSGKGNEENRMEGGHYSGRSGTARGLMRTLVQAGAPPCVPGAGDSPPCLRSLLDLAEKLAAPQVGCPLSSPTTSFSSNLPSLQGTMINFKYKFGHHSPALSDSLPQLQGETPVPQHGLEGLSWSHFSTCCRCTIFIHIPAIPNHLSFPTPVALTLPSCLCACFPSIRNATPYISLASHYSQHKHRYHHYQQDLKLELGISFLFSYIILGI